MIDDAQAAHDALRARVDRIRHRPTPAPIPGASTDVEAFDAAVARAVEAHERRQADAAARAEQERREADAVGGPCRYCGAIRSWQRDDNGRPVGKWYAGPACALCEADRHRFQATDGEHRELVLRRLLPAEITRWWTHGSLSARTGFRWWHQTPGAPTSERERFAYANIDELAARLAPKPVEHETREPCTRCGCPSMWLYATGQATADPRHGMVSTWVCTGCRNVVSLVQLTCSVTGLSPAAVESLGPAAEQVLGVHWWVDDPAGGAADPPAPCVVPFAYVDRAATRRRAFGIFPDERSWGNPAAWQRARAS